MDRKLSLKMRTEKTSQRDLEIMCSLKMLIKRSKIILSYFCIVVIYTFKTQAFQNVPQNCSNSLC